MREKTEAKYYAEKFYPLISRDADKLLADLKRIRDFIVSDPRVADFLKHPSFSFFKKLKFVFRGLGAPVRNEAKEILYILIQSRNAGMLPGIIAEIENTRKKMEGFRNVRISSAFKLPAGQRKALVEKISAVTGSGIVPEFTVDPNLIAGFVIKIGDDVIDNSIFSKLEKLKSQFNTQG